MAIVNKPDGENVTLYDIPDDQLEQYKISPEKAAQMFPEAEGAPSEPLGTVKASNVSGGDVQAYSNMNICWRYYCNPWRCWYAWWYC